MKFYRLFLVCALLGLAGCSRGSDPLSSLQTKWKRLKTLWGEDSEGMLASEGFYGPIEEEFIPLEEDDLQMQFAETVIPQPREVPGAPGGGLPSLNMFKRAMADLAYVFQNVHFNTDDYVLRRPEHLEIIDRMASYLKKHPYTYVSVGGHCDERGSEAYNLALGTRRSNYVRSLLVQRGVDANHIHSISYGKEQPANFGHNAPAWAKNRRAEFKIYQK
ncbi:MAG: Outer membrane protein P6 [Chlamydiae bacterium]|nr:Outer membrane protein P6 [Chlamydiota bacterium]